MSALDHLPPDQRAVLTLVLQRGRSYDDIASLLSIDRAAVRDRALAALDALGPSTRITAPSRALITDYLLGQLPDRVNEQTRASLASSASERAWARVVAGELAPIASKPLPEIPSGKAAAEPAISEDTAASPKPTEPVDPAPERQAAAPAAAAAAAAPVPARGAAAAVATADDAARLRPGGGGPPQLTPQRPSSRRGGAVLLAVGALIVVAVVIVVIATSGGSSPTNTTATNLTPAGTGTTTTGTGTGTTPTTAAKPHVIAQISLRSPIASSKAAGVADVVSEGKITALVIAADHMPPNTGHDAYAVWLYSPGGTAQFLGYVSPGVGKNGQLKTTGQLPANAASFKDILVTRETTTNTKTPGPTVLAGALGLSGG